MEEEIGRKGKIEEERARGREGMRGGERGSE